MRPVDLCFSAQPVSEQSSMQWCLAVKEEHDGPARASTSHAVGTV